MLGAKTQAAASGQPLPRRGIHRILVCHVSHTLGNTLLLTPLIAELQKVYPGAEIDVVTRSLVAQDIFGGFERVRHIYSVPRHGVTAPQRIAGILSRLRERRYDLAIDPCVRSKSDRLYVMAAKATWKLGYASNKGGELTHAVDVPSHLRHVGQLPVHLLRSALGQVEEDAYPPLDIRLSADERAAGHRTLRDIAGGGGPIFGMFTSATGPKHLGAEWWRRFAAHAAATNPGVRFVEIIPLAGASMLDNAFPTFYSTDVRRLAAMLSGLSLFVGADGGVMHLACASGTPTVGLFRGTDVAEWGPYGPRDRAIDIGDRTPEDIADVSLVLHAEHARRAHDLCVA
ncbi:MAG TPA: glycosyltransferase family 9 protein [Rhodanobacteraceae bacterium]|nr:glycosyltransferase family 9 protein [Rhodanobacteraceae bacterium]